MKKRIVSEFEKEWAKDSRGRKLPYPLVDGKFQSAFLFSLIDEFKATFEARAPLTLSLALMCAIEQAGRSVLMIRHPNRDYFGNRECFDEFLQKYMGYRKIVSNRYDIFRNGIVHTGFPKSEKGSGVGLDTHVYFLSRKKLKGVRGIHIHRDGDCEVTFSVLLKEFEDGARKLRWHEIKYKWSWAEAPNF
jgi:hypothetical protein